MDTALQLGPGFQNMLVFNILGVKKEKKKALNFPCDSSAAVLDGMRPA